MDRPSDGLDHVVTIRKIAVGEATGRLVQYRGKAASVVISVCRGVDGDLVVSGTIVLGLERFITYAVSGTIVR